MKTLFMAWQARDATRAWFPIGRLDVDEALSNYSFEYTGGALKAQLNGFAPLLAFPKFDEKYTSSSLFPLFQNRLISRTRADFDEYIHSLAMADGASVNPLEVLAVSGGERKTDSLQIFPKIELTVDRKFSTRFFVHGTRHLLPMAWERVSRLKVDEALHIALEMGNPVGGIAVQIQSDDYVMLGWSPRYLVDDLAQSLVTNRCDLKALVRRVNGSDIPFERRLLVELSGCYPEGNDPMTSPDYQSYLVLRHAAQAAH